MICWDQLDDVANMVPCAGSSLDTGGLALVCALSTSPHSGCIGPWTPALASLSPSAFGLTG